MRKFLVTILGYLSMAAIGQAANFGGEEFAAAGGFARALLNLGGDANRGKFVLIPIHPAGEAHAQGPGIELVGFAFAVEGDGGDEKTLRSGLDELMVEDKTKAAGLFHGIDHQALSRPLLDL